MEIERQEPEGLALRLTEKEIVQLNNALNEICHGFAVENFQAAMGISKESAAQLMQRVHALHVNQAAFFALDELLAVRNALTVVLGELHPLEFHPRIGSEVEDAVAMRDALDLLTGRLQLHKTA
jgi:hypothetical protein